MNPETLKRRWLREDEEKIDNAIDALYKHETGRKLLWWLLTTGKVGGQPFTGDALTTAFSCGELNVGQQILARMLNVSAEGYVNLTKEMNDEHKRRDAELDLLRDTAGTEEPSDGTAE